ncbi:MAG: UvrABC system protein [Planctomycetota bacterium]
MPAAPNRLTFDAGTLLLEISGGPIGNHAKALDEVFGRGLWVWDPRVSRWRTDAYRYELIRKIVDERSLLIDDQVGTAGNSVTEPSSVNQPGSTNPPGSNTTTAAGLADVLREPSANKLPTLRPEQAQAIAGWEKSRQGIIVMPTGTGKTEVALSILSNRRAANSQRPHRALIVAPVRDLMYQWHRRILRGLGIDAGILGDSHRDIRSVTVTTYASACIHAAELGNSFDLLVFDECHHLTGPIRADAARCSVARERLGLTATMPTQTDALLEWIGPVVYELKIDDVRGKTLADYEVVRIPVELNPQERVRYKDLSRQIAKYVYERRKDDPQFTWKDLCSEAASGSEASKMLRLRREKEAIEDRATEKLRVLEDLFRLHLGHSMLIFTGSNAMARAVSTRFLIPCLLAHCGKNERLDYLEGLRDGDYPALVANQVLDEGVDLPEVKVAVVLGGKSSVRQAKQRLGRILRKRGESRAILYEIVAAETKEVNRSRKRRNNDAYEGTRHRQLRKRSGPS